MCADQDLFDEEEEGGLTLDQLAGHCNDDLSAQFTYFHAKDRARLTLKLIEVARLANLGPCRHPAGMDECELCRALSALESRP